MLQFFRRNLGLTFTLFATIGVYALSLGNGFVNLDDPLLVTENAHVLVPSLQNIWYVLTHFDPELYIPVTFLSYQIETWILGTNAWHFHLVNLLLHLGSIILVHSIIQKISGNKTIAVVTAALFALHPINAEAVLWISARKDLLAALFSLATIGAYMQGNKKWYIWSIVFFLLALGSKVSVVALPLALVFIAEVDEPLLRENKKWKRTLPFFALSVLFGLIAIAGKGAVTEQFEWTTLIVMMFRSILFYLQLVFIPTGQSAVHAISPNLFPPMNMLAFAIVIGVSFGFWKTRKKWPALFGAWVFFLLMLAPTFLHYTRGSNTLMLGSERYMYLPSIGMFFIIATVWSELRKREWRLPLFDYIFRGASLLILLVLGFLTFLRTFVFADAIIFNLDILQKYPGNARASYNLGVALERDKRPMDAEEAYQASALADPTFVDPLLNLGILFMGEGRKDEAIEMFEKAVKIRPDYFKTHFNLGVAEQQLGNVDAAIASYKKTIELFPDFPEVRKNLATIYGQKKMFKEALAEYEILATIDPGFAQELEKIKASQGTR